MNDEIKEILDILKNCKDYDDEVFLIKQHSATLLYDYITNLQQAFEKSYTEEQLDFAVNEVKEQLKIEKQYSNQLCNKIDELRIKNYELQQENKKMPKRFRNCKKIKDNYKSRCEKINEIIKESPDFNYSNDYIILKRRIESVLQGENNE